MLTRVGRRTISEELMRLHAMSEEQLSALLAKLKDDAGLREKLQGVAGFDAAVALAREAGFDVRKADWLRYQAKQTLMLSDEELEGVAGGVRTVPPACTTVECRIIESLNMDGSPCDWRKQ